MSEFHPSRPAVVKTTARMRRQRILESWPYLVWIGVGLVAFRIYTHGTSFVRMNGAVDVNHQYVTSIADGKIARILVQEGQKVEPGAVVAEMDSGPLRHQLNALLLGLSSTRREEMLRLDRIRIDLEAELRNYAITAAEGDGRLAPLKRFLERVQRNPSASSGQSSGSVAAALNRSLILPADLNVLESEVGEITSRVDAVRENIKSVEKELEHVNTLIKKTAEDAATAMKAGSDEISDALLAALSETERTELVELKGLIDATRLRAPKGGVVDRLDRNEGEYVRAGDSILQVVAETGRIVGFLPQAHIGKLQAGDTVWVTPAHDRNAVWQSTVTTISSRISSVYDASSPLPNQRIYGRNITVRLPEAVNGVAPPLVPGQTVVIHTSRPGSVPLLNRLFPVEATVTLP